MSIVEDFRVAIRTVGVDGAEPEYLPSLLSLACTLVLPVAGVSISLFPPTEIWLPLGASDDSAAAAARLQFTTAQGPCVDALTSAQPVLATEGVMSRRWPGFHAGLITQTPYRAAVAVPMTAPLFRAGTVDLYFHRSVDLADLAMLDATSVITELCTYLHAATDFGPAGVAEPSWLNSPTASPRAAVPIATGMLRAALDVSATDALALLRAHAFTVDRSVDEVAADVVGRRISAVAFRLDTDT